MGNKIKKMMEMYFPGGISMPLSVWQSLVFLWLLSMLSIISWKEGVVGNYKKGMSHWCLETEFRYNLINNAYQSMVYWCCHQPLTSSSVLKWRHSLASCWNCGQAVLSVTIYCDILYDCYSLFKAAIVIKLLVDNSRIILYRFLFYLEN